MTVTGLLVPTFLLAKAPVPTPVTLTEMAVTDFGQYAHSNQPVHHALWLFTEAGRPGVGAHQRDEGQRHLHDDEHVARRLQLLVDHVVEAP